ncbi:MAG TPA: hypothetical protein VIX83_00210 [Candidatus Cybelea sp.]
MRNRILGSCAPAMVLLAGCGGSQLPSRVGAASAAAPLTFSHHKTFRYTGKRERFKVPAGVAQIRVIAIGGSSGGSNTVARGGRVSAMIPVHPSEVLVINVGGAGTLKGGGFNGGAPGGADQFGRGDAYGGGGASDIREGGHALGDRILVAGGAGGQGGFDDARSGSNGAGGKGGGMTGGTGELGSGGYGYEHCPASSDGDYGYGGCGGTGGSQTVGGAGGAGGTGPFCYGTVGGDGAPGLGGDGGGLGTSSYAECGGFGGGGGGGYYGGGGGGEGSNFGSSPIGGGGGGGGGSSYAENGASGVRMWQGWKQSQYAIVVFDW